MHRFRSRLRVLALTTLVLSASCSWAASFVVANLSDVPIQLQYTLRRVDPLAGLPAVKSSTGLTDPQVPWQTLTINPEHVDSVYEYVFSLAPHTVAQIYTLINYQEPGGVYNDIYSGLHLSVRSAHGAQQYEDGQILRAFRKHDRALYILEVR